MRRGLSCVSGVGQCLYGCNYVEYILCVCRFIDWRYSRCIGNTCSTRDFDTFLLHFVNLCTMYLLLYDTLRTWSLPTLCTPQITNLSIIHKQSIHEVPKAIFSVSCGHPFKCAETLPRSARPVIKGIIASVTGWDIHVANQQHPVSQPGSSWALRKLERGWKASPPFVQFPFFASSFFPSCELTVQIPHFSLFYHIATLYCTAC